MKKTKLNRPNPQDPVEKLIASEQMELTGMNILSLLQFGGQTLLKNAIADEITHYLQREHYKHLKPGQVFKGQRNGYRKTTIDSPIGPIQFDRPLVAHAPDFKSQYHSPYMRRPEEFAAAISEMYVNGVSTRKVKDTLKSISGERVKLSKSTVSRITKRLRDEFSKWKHRDLSGLSVAYLFVDAIHVGMRMGEKGKDAIFVAYAILESGQFEPVSIGLGHSESKRGWGRFISDLKQRGLKDPLLCVSDGNFSVIEALENNFPTSYRQRCTKHKVANVLDTIPKVKHPEMRKRISRIFYGATSLEQAKLFIKDFKKEFGKKYPTAIECLDRDLEQCLTFYLFPANHWKRIRTSNKLERLNLEIRRRLKVIGRHPSEEGCMALIYQLSSRYSFRQQNVKANDLTVKLWQKLRQDKVSMLEQLELDLFAA